VRLTSALYNEELVNSKAELLKKFKKFLDSDIKSSHDNLADIIYANKKIFESKQQDIGKKISMICYWL
jgi:hypothetical protein